MYCKKVLGPAVRRELVNEMITSYPTCERQACESLGWTRSNHSYKSRADRQDILRMRLKGLSSVIIGYGYRRLHILLRREG